MLKPAQLFSQQLKEKLWATAYDERYKFVNGTYMSIQDLSIDNYNDFEFVSVDSANNLIGYFAYQVDRAAHVASGVVMLSFTDGILFAKDVYQAIDDVFCKYNFNKIKFSVYVGNKVERTYDRLVEKCNGRIVGVEYRDIKLLDGEIYDRKLYEIHRDEYIKRRPNRFAKDNTL